MTEKELSIGRDLFNNWKSANKNLEDFWQFQKEHDSQPEKELSLSKTGHGWISLPAEIKSKLLPVIEDFLISESAKAEKLFNDFKTENTH